MISRLFSSVVPCKSYHIQLRMKELKLCRLVSVPEKEKKSVCWSNPSKIAEARTLFPQPWIPEIYKRRSGAGEGESWFHSLKVGFCQIQSQVPSNLARTWEWWIALIFGGLSQMWHWIFKFCWSLNKISKNSLAKVRINTRFTTSPFRNSAVLSISIAMVVLSTIFECFLMRSTISPNSFSKGNTSSLQNLTVGSKIVSGHHLPRD